MKGVEKKDFRHEAEEGKRDEGRKRAEEGEVQSVCCAYTAHCGVLLRL